MKKKIILLIILLTPFFVYADTCSVIEDKQTTLDRTITCDKTSETATSFKTTKDEKIFSNDVCEISCSEEIIFSVDSIKKVLAGTSFNYPLYVSGKRVCNATYKYVEYETTIKRLVSEYASLTGTSKITKGNELTNYYAKKKACDEFTKEDSNYFNKYKVDGKVSLKVETSLKTENIAYSYKNISDYSSKVENDEAIYSACNYDENSRTCKNNDRALSSWTETARIFGKYTMPNTYVEKYTGEIKSVATETTCNAGDRYFTSFDELTKPVSGAINDNGYKLTLIGTKLGNNIISTGDVWNLTVNCSYKVNNLSFPQGGGAGENSAEDENYSELGNNAFMFRIIDLDNPFPDREPGANWYGKESLIKSANMVTKFEININSSSVKTIREYNSNYPYDTFNLNEMEKSLFIINNTSIVKRK